MSVVKDDLREVRRDICNNCRAPTIKLCKFDGFKRLSKNTIYACQNEKCFLYHDRSQIKSWLRA
jgi:2-phosphoglycerate kinase